MQQTILQVAGCNGLGPLALLAIAFPVTYALALLSWRLVEQPALSLKRTRPQAAVTRRG